MRGCIYFLHPNTPIFQADGQEASSAAGGRVGSAVRAAPPPSSIDCVDDDAVVSTVYIYIYICIYIYMCVCISIHICLY